MNCNNCFGAIADQRKETRCETCKGALHKDCSIKAEGKFYCDNCFTVLQIEKPAIEFEIPTHIRRTYIEEYRKCPHKFFLHVIQGNAEPSTCYTQIGSDLHELFEKAVKDRSYTLDQMKQEFYETYWNNYNDELFELSSREKMEERAIDSMDAIYEYIKILPMPFATEETIHYSIGDDLPLVEFTMDLITENENGNLDMHDWKTGKVMVGKNIEIDLQAPLYIQGVQQHYGRQVDSFTFYYLQENKTRTFKRVNSDTFVCTVGKREYKVSLQDTVREIQRVFNQIKKGNFNIPQDVKKMYFTCKMCHFKNIGLCRGADEESWYQ